MCVDLGSEEVHHRWEPTDAGWVYYKAVISHSWTKLSARLDYNHVQKLQQYSTVSYTLTTTAAARRQGNESKIIYVTCISVWWTVCCQCTMVCCHFCTPSLFLVLLLFFVVIEDSTESSRLWVSWINSAFHPSSVGKSSTSLLAGVNVGNIYLCRAVGNTVFPHGRWRPVALRRVFHEELHTHFTFLLLLLLHCVSKKTSHFVVRSNFNKYWRIFKIPSVIYSVENLQ